MPTPTHNRIPGVRLIQAPMTATALDIRVEPWWRLWFWGFVDGRAVGGWHMFVRFVTEGQGKEARTWSLTVRAVLGVSIGREASSKGKVTRSTGAADLDFGRVSGVFGQKRGALYNLPVQKCC